MNEELERIAARSHAEELHYSLLPEAQRFLHEPDSTLQIHLLDYWKVLIKRWWIVLTTLILFVSVTAFNTWRQPPVYRASLKLQIDNEQPGILPFRDVSEFAYVNTDEYLKTQFEALTSRTLATRVIHTMNLEKDPRFIREAKPDAVDRLLSRAKRELSQRFVWPKQRDRAPHQKSPANSKYTQTFSPLADKLLSSIAVNPVKDSSVVVVSCDAGDPTLAADIVNTLAAEYIQMNFETKYKSTIMASDFLARQLVDIKAQVEKSEQQMVEFGQTHNIYSLGENQNVIMQKLADLNAALTQAQAERIQKESAWKIARQSPHGDLPDALNTNDIKALEGTVAGLQQQYAKLRAVYKPAWWEVKEVAGQLETAQKQLAQLRETRLRDMGTAYQTALQREKLLSEAVRAQKSEADTLNQYSIQYNILKQEVASKKQLYNDMLQRMGEAGITAGLKSNNIHVVDAAVPPGSPILPDKKGNLTKALLSGLVFGVVLGFFFEYVGSYFDRSLKTPDDVDRLVHLPFLGLIPSTRSLSHSGRRGLLAMPLKTQQDGSGRTGSNGRHGSLNIELITLWNTRSIISEAYRHLRTSILLSSNGQNRLKTIVVTSSKRGEGKTNTCINLAVTLAQANKKVLLMDCDLRNPKIHRILQLSNREGVSFFLSNGSKPLQHLIVPTSIPDLFVLTSGQMPPNPSELIGSPLMKKCLAILSQHFDHILIDTPPLLAVTDGCILANIVDGVILVIRGGDTTREAIIRSKHLLNSARARIIGTMLNNVDMHACDHYYSRYFYDYAIEGVDEEEPTDIHRAVGGEPNNLS
jgi:succinoglycan biosynthesis transport protein ExoP